MTRAQHSAGFMAMRKDLVVRRHPGATARRGRWCLAQGQWAIVSADGQVLGSGTNPSRAWDDAAAKLGR